MSKTGMSFHKRMQNQNKGLSGSIGASQKQSMGGPTTASKRQVGVSVGGVQKPVQRVGQQPSAHRR